MKSVIKKIKRVPSPRNTRLFFILFASVTLLTGSFLSGCGSSGATADEWLKFKSEAKIKIDNNDLRIAQLRTQRNESGKSLDAVYDKRISTLQQENTDMRNMIDSDEHEHSDWKTFKIKFNGHMDNIEDELKEITH